jgi:hypothetical protein
MDSCVRQSHLSGGSSRERGKKRSPLLAIVDVRLILPNFSGVIQSQDYLAIRLVDGQDFPLVWKIPSDGSKFPILRIPNSERFRRKLTELVLAEFLSGSAHRCPRVIRPKPATVGEKRHSPHSD